MKNLKNYNYIAKYLFLVIFFFIMFSCNLEKNYVTKIEGKKIAISIDLTQNNEIDNYIKPYRDKINKDMSEVLAFNPETLDKSGTWQSNIGNFLADITMEYGNKVYQKRNNKKIDIVLMNHGGIRSILPKGGITLRNAYQIMPFENSLCINELKGLQILELCQHIVSEKKPHPISGLSFSIELGLNIINIQVQGKPLEMDKIYSVATSDYLSNGGDNMLFFKKNVGSHDMDYKLRNVLVDYLKDADTVKVDKSVRIKAIN